MAREARKSRKQQPGVQTESEHQEVTTTEIAELESVLAGMTTAEMVPAEQSETPEAPAMDPGTPSEEPQAPEETVEQAPIETRSLVELVGAVDEDTRKQAATQIAGGFDSRIAFEKAKNADNGTIQASLAKSRAKLTTPDAAAFLTAIAVDTGFMNRSVSTGSGYNVYAIDKLADLVRALDKGDIGNAINKAVCRSLFQFRAAKEPFTGEMAKAAVSDKIRVTGSIAKLLVRHTVSAATAPTQASSTMQALGTLGIVKNTGSVKFPVYQLTDSPACKRLEEVVQKLAA